MKKLKVSIKNRTTLRLEEDGSKGDLIDLEDVLGLDTEPILKRIKEDEDKVYKELLKEEKEKLLASYKLELSNEASKYEKEIAKLDQMLKSKEQEVKNELIIKHNEELNKLRNELVKEKTDNEIKHVNELNIKENEIKDLKNDLHNIKLEQEKHYQDIISEKEINYIKEKQLLTNEIDNLKRERSSLSTKNIGEDLEIWCDNEFNSTGLQALDNVVWKKDNEVVKGGKADFIYEVYASGEKLEDELLTSVILEMKSEDPNSTNTQDINRFLKKLDKDRTNKNIEYALLVSELAGNEPSSPLIKRVVEYDNMYIVRPEYFISLLSIITTLSFTYKDLLLAKKEERIKFKDYEDVLEEFNTLKDEILSNSVRHINTHLEEIIKQSENIKSANEKILASAELILNRHIKTVENKLNDFRINYIADKIKNLE